MIDINAYVPPYFKLWHLPVVFLAGLIGQGYGTIVGGAGVLIQLTLTTLGLPLASVVATDLAGCWGAAIGVMSASLPIKTAWRKRKLLLLLALPILLGGILGTFFLMHTSTVLLSYVLIIGLSLLLVHVLRQKKTAVRTAEEFHFDMRHYPLIFVILFVMGVYENVSGVGSGAFLRLIFISFFHVSVVDGLGIGNFIYMPSGLYFLAATAWAGLIVWPYCVALWFGTYIGGRYATLFARKIPNHYLRWLLIAVVSAYLVWLIISLVR